MMTTGLTNPYESPPSSSAAEPKSALVATFGSLAATVPVGLAVSLILRELGLMHGGSGVERTAYCWAASSLVASLICSIAVARFTFERIAWYHFFVIYQFGWIVYFFVGFGGANYGTVPNANYFWTPFIIPAIVACIAPCFNSRKMSRVE